VYSMVQRREKEKDSRYIDETSTPAAVTVYQICDISPAQIYQQQSARNAERVLHNDLTCLAN
jgi:hypothetical protein